MRLILLLFWAGLAQAAPTSYFFLQFSDPQFGMYEENRGFAQETANLEFAVATANRLHPAFVVITGDLINRAGDAGQAADHESGVEFVESDAARGRDRARDRRYAVEFERHRVDARREVFRR